MKTNYTPHFVMQADDLDRLTYEDAMRFVERVRRGNPGGLQKHSHSTGQTIDIDGVTNFIGVANNGLANLLFAVNPQTSLVTFLRVVSAPVPVLIEGEVPDFPKPTDPAPAEGIEKTEPIEGTDDDIEEVE